MINETIRHRYEQYNFLTQQLTKYAGSSLYLVCLCGAIMNLLTFSQRTYNRRACSLYILIASACDFIHINLGLLSNILQYGFHYHWTITSVSYCKTKTYLVYVLTIISATLTVLATINRYMLSSTKSSRWKYGSRSIGIRCIALTIFFWLTISIPILLFAQRFYHSSHNEQMVCSISCPYSACVVIQILYVCLLNGFLPPLLMIMFSFLTYNNARRLYQRSQVKSIPVRRINEQLTSMLIIQSMKSICTSIPYSIFHCYWILTSKQYKSLLHEAKENLVNEIVHLLFWSNYTSFCIYICSSSVFRDQSIRALKNLICCRWTNRRDRHRYRNQ